MDDVTREVKNSDQNAKLNVIFIRNCTKIKVPERIEFLVLRTQVFWTNFPASRYCIESQLAQKKF